MKTFTAEENEEACLRKKHYPLDHRQKAEQSARRARYGLPDAAAFHVYLCPHCKNGWLVGAVDAQSERPFRRRAAENLRRQQAKIDRDLRAYRGRMDR